MNHIRDTKKNIPSGSSGAYTRTSPPVPPANVRSRRSHRMASSSEEADIESPCRRIEKLDLNQQPDCTSKRLLSTKSLTQLIPKKFIFSRRRSTGDVLHKNKKGHKVNHNKNDEEPDQTPVVMMDISFGHDESITSSSGNQSGFSGANRVGSASLIGFPRQSTNNSLGYISCEQSTIIPNHLSPIAIASHNEMMKNVLASTPTVTVRPLKVVTKEQQEDKKEEAAKSKATKMTKYKSLKNTALALRDVKNSISLRIKARHESKAFETLKNELTTPPIKLYSPFNIYTPNCKEPKEMKSKRRLNLNKNTNGKVRNDLENDSGNYSMASQQSSDNSHTRRSPKGRIALQHKKHLMQANKFTFDSPTGRLRETVKDVEQFQQCIEDISKAIKSRGLRN